MGINPNTGEAAASSDNSVPDETEDVGNEDESIVHNTASVGDVEVCFIIEVIKKKSVEGADAEHISLVHFTLNLSYNWN
jgi:hypothetical protein